MTAGKILNKKEEQLLVQLIGAQEDRTTGEIRIHIAKRASRRGPMADAARVFKHLGMDKTEHHNGVLIFVAVKSRHLACIGDKGIHEKVGDEAWQKIVARIREDFAKGDFFFGLKYAVESVGDLLARHFPSGGKPPTHAIANTISRG